MMKRIFAKISAFVFLLVCQSSFAASLLNVTTNGTKLIITPVPNHSYPAASIQVNTAGYCLANPGAGCVSSATFSASNASPKIFSIAGPAGTLSLTICLNGNGPLTCQNYTTNNTPAAYVSNFLDDSVSLCPINADGTFGACGSSGITGAPFTDTYQVALNKIGTIAYVPDRGGDIVRRCPVNANGTFGTCLDSGNTGVAFLNPSGIVLNSAGTIAYVTNQIGTVSTGVSVCPINADGSFGTCVYSGNTGVPFAVPDGIALNNAGNIAYVANFNNNTVSMCPINANGTFGACAGSGNTGIAFAGPVGIALNNAGTIAYVTNFFNNDTVSMCPINANGTFGACVDSGNTGIAFNDPFGLTLNNAGTIAYVANSNNNTVSMCPINPNGTFGACTSAGNTGVAFNEPFWVTLR